MVRLPFALLLSLTLLALAGCAEDAEPAPGDGAGLAAPAPADPDSARLVDEQGQPVPLREERLQVSGRSATGACAGAAGTGQCFNDLGDGNLHELGRGAVAVRGTLAWSAPTPATAAMSVIVLVPCGDGCWTSGSGLSVAGESPLQVDLDLAGIDEPMALWFSSYQGASTPAGAWGGASLPQEFTFDGVVVALAG